MYDFGKAMHDFIINQWKRTELFFQKEKLSLLSITTGRTWSPFFWQFSVKISTAGMIVSWRKSSKSVKINWLEQSEEDPLVYNKGTFDEQNSPKCIMDRVSVDREAEQFILRRNEERRLRNLAHGHVDNVSDDSGDESQEEENLAEVEDEEPSSSSRSRFEAGHSRSGRRVTRYLL